MSLDSVSHSHLPLRMEEEVSKEKFKELYFQYAVPCGWSEDQWNQVYAKKEGARFFYSEPSTPESTRVFIVSDSNNHRMIFLTEEAEESFFDFPGK